MDRSQGSRLFRSAAVVAALLLGACGSDDGDRTVGSGAGPEAAGATTDPPAGVDPAGEPGPSQDVTGADDPTPDGWTIPTEACGVMGAIFLEPIDASWEPGYDTDLDGDDVRGIVELLPEEHRGVYLDAADLVERLHEDPDLEPTVADMELAERLDRVAEELWVRVADGCGADGPFWVCGVRETFQNVGHAITDDGPPSFDDGEPWPADFAGTDPDGILGEDWDIEIHRGDDAVVVARVDAEGLVTQRAHVTATAGGWSQKSTTSCSDGWTGATEKFEKFEEVGESVGDVIEGGG